MSFKTSEIEYEYHREIYDKGRIARSNKKPPLDTQDDGIWDVEGVFDMLTEMQVLLDIAEHEIGGESDGETG